MSSSHKNWVTVATPCPDRHWYLSPRGCNAVHWNTICCSSPTWPLWHRGQILCARGTPCTRPETQGRLWLPGLKLSKVCVHACVISQPEYHLGMHTVRLGKACMICAQAGTIGGAHSYCTNIPVAQENLAIILTLYVMCRCLQVAHGLPRTTLSTNSSAVFQTSEH